MTNQPPVSTGGILKPKKTNNMPLGPKQQPPYYVPESMPTPPSGGGTTRLNTQTTAVPTSGTAETLLYTYTIPANTLTNNGDTILIHINGSNIGNAVAHNLNIDFDGIQLFGLNETGESYWTATIQLIRQTSSIIMGQIQMWGTINQFGIPSLQSQTGLDFTTPITIDILGQCPVSGSSNTYNMTIDKISI